MLGRGRRGGGRGSQIQVSLLACNSTCIMDRSVVLKDPRMTVTSPATRSSIPGAFELTLHDLFSKNLRCYALPFPSLSEQSNMTKSDLPPTQITPQTMHLPIADCILGTMHSSIIASPCLREIQAIVVPLSVMATSSVQIVLSQSS